MKAQAVEEHLFAHEMHFLNCDEQGGHAASNDRAEQRSNQENKNIMIIYMRTQSYCVCSAFIALELVHILPHHENKLHHIKSEIYETVVHILKVDRKLLTFQKELAK